MASGHPQLDPSSSSGPQPPKPLPRRGPHDPGLAHTGPARITRPSLSRSCGQRNSQASGRAVPGVRGVSPLPTRRRGLEQLPPRLAPFLGLWGDCLAGLPGPPLGGLPRVGRGAGTWLPRYATAVGRQPRRRPPPGGSVLLLHCKAALAGGLQLELAAWHCRREAV